MSKQNTDSAKFRINEETGGFYVTISDDLIVYEAYEDAVADIQDVLDQDDNAFIAKMSIEGSGDDVEVNLEQVGWQKIIKDMG